MSNATAHDGVYQLMRQHIEDAETFRQSRRDE
jgi:hypothetical protein